MNPAPDPMDLSGYYIGDEAGNFVYGLSGQLAGYGLQLVTGSQAVAWETANGQSTTGLRMGNDGDTVTLWQVVNGLNVLIDTYTYNTYEAEDDRSTGRASDGAASWVIFDALNPYSGQTPPAGTGLAPTPGATNGGGTPPPTPVAAATWGEIKQLFETP